MSTKTTTQETQQEEEYHSIIKNTERGKGQFSSTDILVNVFIILTTVLLLLSFK
jgi:hypothetical protein